MPNQKVSRRGFLSLLGLGWVTFASACSGAALGTLRYFYPNVEYAPPTLHKIGKPDDYAMGEVDTRWKAKYRIWVIRDNDPKDTFRPEKGDYVYVLLAVCTHLGCTPNWLPQSYKFKCPCHGSGFKKSGVNFEGPAPRPLERVKVFLSPEGNLTIDLSKTYREELGEWSDPSSYVKLS